MKNNGKLEVSSVKDKMRIKRWRWFELAETDEHQLGVAGSRFRSGQD